MFGQTWMTPNAAQMVLVPQPWGPLLTRVQGREEPPPSDLPLRAPRAGLCVPLRRALYLKGLHAHQGSSSLPVQAPRGGVWPPAQTSPLPILFLPAQVASLGRAIHLQLCSVRIPQAKENALQAITLLARNHTSELVAAFLDFSIPLDRCSALLPAPPPCPPSLRPQAKGRTSAPCLPSCLPMNRAASPEGVLICSFTVPLLGPSLGRHHTPSLLSVTP